MIRRKGWGGKRNIISRIEIRFTALLWLSRCIGNIYVACFQSFYSVKCCYAAPLILMMSSSSTTVSFSSISYFYLYHSFLQITSPFFILLRPPLFQSIPLLLLLLLILPSQPLPLSTSFTIHSSISIHNTYYLLLFLA